MAMQEISDYQKTIAHVINHFSQQHMKIKKPTIQVPNTIQNQHLVKSVILELDLNPSQGINEFNSFNWQTGRRSDASEESKQFVRHARALHEANKAIVDSFNVAIQSQSACMQRIDTIFSDAISFAHIKEIYKKVPGVTNVKPYPVSAQK